MAAVGYLPIRLPWSGAQRSRNGNEFMHMWSFLVAIVLCGFLFGGLVAGELKPQTSSALAQAVLQLLQAVMAHQLAPASSMWWHRIIGDGQVLALIWLFGVSIIGAPFVIITLFLRAFSTGFAVGFTILQFGWKGLFIAGTTIFLHQIVSITALIVAGGFAIRFSLRLLKQNVPLHALSLQFIKYTLWFVIPACGLMVGAFIQAVLAPHLLGALFTSH